MTDRIVPGVYSKANGNGPLHLTVESPLGRATLCGVRGGPIGGPPGVGRAKVCRTCERLRERSVDAPAIAALEAGLPDLFDVLWRARAAEADLRRRIEDLTPYLQAARHLDSLNRDRIIVAASHAGMDQGEIGALLGITRQAVSARLTRLSDGDT